MQTLALDIGGSKLLAAATRIDRGDFRIDRVEHCDLPPGCTKQRILSLIEESVQKLGPVEFENVGVTIPGLADPGRGLWVYAPFSGIRDFPIASILSDRFGGKPVHIDNDVNACAWAEKQFGVCRNVNDFLWITVSNGVGGGLVLDGKVRPGRFGAAAEIGHFRLVEGPRAFPCGCGNSGCLEAEAAGPGIARRYERLLHESGRNGSNGSAHPLLSAREIAALARQGDPVALSVLETTGSLLGKAAAYAVNLMNLEAVVFGGGVMESFDLVFPSLEKTFYTGLFRSGNPKVRLEKTALGYHAALAGAAALVLSR